MNVEVFLDKSRGLTIVQMRAPVAPGRHREHASMLAAWIKSAGFSCVKSSLLLVWKPVPKTLLVAFGLNCGQELMCFCSGVVSLATLPIHARRELQLAAPEIMRAVQTSSAASSAAVAPPLALPLEPELLEDPAIWRPRSSTVRCSLDFLLIFTLISSILINIDRVSIAFL